jgi:hypothetical protein
MRECRFPDACPTHYPPGESSGSPDAPAVSGSVARTTVPPAGRGRTLEAAPKRHQAVPEAAQATAPVEHRTTYAVVEDLNDQ